MRPTGEIFPNFTSDWTIEFDKEVIVVFFLYFGLFNKGNVMYIIYTVYSHTKEQIYHSV